MENFISGFPGCEYQIREALADTIGEEKSALFFDRFLEHFFGDEDAAFFKSLGLNAIRIAFNYHHFEGIRQCTNVNAYPELIVRQMTTIHAF